MEKKGTAEERKRKGIYIKRKGGRLLSKEASPE